MKVTEVEAEEVNSIIQKILGGENVVFLGFAVLEDKYNLT